MSGRVEIRRELRPGDLGQILALHGQIFSREFGVDWRHEAIVASSIAECASRGFPRERERAWIVEQDGTLAGSLGLTDEGETGVVRWFLLDPSLRGRELGRRLLDELVSEAKDLRFARLRLEAFSLLRAAGHLYRSFGFEVVDEDTRARWGLDSVTYQYYEVELAPPRPRRARPTRLHALAH